MRIYLSDGISLNGGKLNFDPKTSDNIKTNLGKYGFRPYVKTIGDLKILSVYTKNTKSTKRDLLDALHALKTQKKTNIEDYNKILKRAALFAYRNFKNTKIDLIVSIESSSELTNDFIIHLINYIPNKEGISYMKNIIHKNKDVSNIKIEDNPNISDEIKNQLNVIVNKAKKSGLFEIKKVPPQFRKFLKNWLSLEKKLNPKIFNKNVLLVDDYVTSGVSMYEANEILKNNGAKNIYGLSLIKL